MLETISKSLWLFVSCLQVPRVGGIKKGWVKQFVVVCDFKLFLYDVREDRTTTTAGIVVNQVLDMR